MDGDDGEDDADDVDAVMLVAVPDTVGGVGVRVLTPDVSEAGDTTRRDLRLPFCWPREVELKEGVNCEVAVGLTETAVVIERLVVLFDCTLELPVVRFLGPPFFPPVPPFRFSFFVIIGSAGLGLSSLWPTNSAQPTG